MARVAMSTARHADSDIPADAARRRRPAVQENRPLPSPGRRLERAALLAAMLACALAIWTVVPLAWLWVGSQLTDSTGAGGSSAPAYAVVAFGILCSEVLIYVGLSALGRRHDRITGHEVSPAGRRAPWLRSMRGERGSPRGSLSAVERVMILSVLLAVVAYEVWFITSAGSPLPSP